MAKQEHIDKLLQGVQAWNKWREEDFFLRPDLSGTNVWQEFEDAGIIGFDEEIPLTGIDFRDSNLIDSDLTFANLTNAMLTKADLSGADLTQANLAGARFTNAKLDGTNLVHTDISRAHFGGVNLSKSKLFVEKMELANEHTQFDPISSIGVLLREFERIKERHDDRTLFYFRGESRDCWELRPSLIRDDVPLAMRARESNMLHELISRRPEEFSNTRAALDQWVLAQHHKLRTRFLDIMKNPLVGLYFASEDKGTGEEDLYDGCLHVFAVPPSLVKPYNSDTVSVIANFAKLAKSDQDVLLGKKLLLSHRYGEAMGRLCQLVQAEKPYFAERIDPRDFYRVLIIQPQQSIERIRAQTGAFLVSGFHERFEKDEVLQWNADTPIYTNYKLTIPKDCKSVIRAELSLLNITKETLLPGLDSSAEAVTRAYQGSSGR